MAEIILVTGGARSGKSRYAQELAESLPGSRIFVATCPVIDKELQVRVDRHRREREQRGWQTVEEGIDLSGVLAAHLDSEVVLVDCLTLWINNLLFADNEVGAVTEDSVSRQCREIIACCRKRSGTVIFVTNEVGMGIVPDNPLARQYRDLMGRCNQELAAVADQVVLLVCGIPMTIKTNL